MRQEKFKTISVIDPALDTATMTMKEVEAFTEARDFALVQGHLAVGQTPVIYHVREVPSALWRSYVIATSSMHEQYRRAFQCGIERVENVVQRDGVAISLEPATRNKFVDATYFSDEETDTHFSHAEQEEIGSVVHQHSFLPLRIESCFQLPSSLLEPLGQRPALRADASLSSAADQNNERPLASTEQSPVKTATATAPVGAA